MNLTKTALKRPVSCVLIILALVVFSISSLLGFKLELTPSMEMPMLIAFAMYPGADPETVDELVSKVIEDAGSSLSGVEDVTAVSMENMCCSSMSTAWISMSATRICVRRWTRLL